MDFCLTKYIKLFPLIFLAIVFSIPYFEVNGFGSILSFYITLVLTLTSFFNHSKFINTLKNFLKFGKNFIILFVLIFFLKINKLDLIESFRQTIYPLIICFTIILLLDDLKKVKFFLNAFILIVTLSSIVAILQSYNIDLLWQLREFFGNYSDDNVNQQIFYRKKPSGLAYFSIQLGYQIILAYAIATIYFILSRSITDKIIYFTAAYFLFFCSTILQSVSLYVCLFIISIYLIHFKFLSNFKIKAEEIYLEFAAILIFIFSAILSKFDRLFFWDESILSRLTFWKVALDNFSLLGKSPDEVNDYVLNLINKVDLSSLPGLNFLLNTSFHNSFLNVFVYYGLLGLLISIVLFIFFLKDIFALKAAQNHKYIFLILFLKVAFLALTFQSLFHNSGLANGDIYFAFLLGLLILLKLK